MRRIPLTAVVAGALTALALVGGAVLPAAADDIPPPVFPSEAAGPEDIGNPVENPSAPPGPVYEVTPGSPGSELPEPVSDPAAPASPGAAGASSRAGPAGQKAPRAQSSRRAAKAGRASAPGSAPTVVRPVAAEVASAPDLSPGWIAAAGCVLALLLAELGRAGRVLARRVRRLPPA